MIRIAMSSEGRADEATNHENRPSSTTATTSTRTIARNEPSDMWGYVTGYW